MKLYKIDVENLPGLGDIFHFPHIYSIGFIILHGNECFVWKSTSYHLRLIFDHVLNASTTRTCSSRKGLLSAKQLEAVSKERERKSH